MSTYSKRQQGRDTIWDCICGEQLVIRRFDDAYMTHTSCGNCGESWWLNWNTDVLNHGTIEAALAALRGEQ